MKLHILGVCGTFMGGLAALAREQGDQVEGSDQNVYPPMSTQLEALGIALASGYSADHVSADCDEIIVGNALSRGNPAVEHVLEREMRYVSGAQWLAERVLRGRTVLAVAGTHGKTTTSSMLAWVLDAQQRDPGLRAARPRRAIPQRGTARPRSPRHAPWLSRVRPRTCPDRGPDHSATALRAERPRCSLLRSVPLP
jgi:hypothetical protein